MEIALTNTKAQARLRHFLVWSSSAALMFPMVVLLHEFAHYIFYRAFGFQGVAMHYNAATSPHVKGYWQLVALGRLNEAAAYRPLWQGGVADAAGILMTVAIVVACCLLIKKYGPRPLLVSAGMLAPIRFFVALTYLYTLLFKDASRMGFDELNIARVTGIPVAVLLVAGLAVLCGGAYWIVRQLQPGERLFTVFSVVAGAIVGGLLYFQVLGPALLP